MAGEHYFTAQPAALAHRRSLEVELAGRRLAVVTAGGVFSPDRVDTGTRVLFREAPAPPQEGTFLDLGCGWGPIALTLGLLSPTATVYAVDVNERALELTRANAVAAGLEHVHAVNADGVPPDVRFDLVWSNPPIRVGKHALHELLGTWLPRLGPDGVAYLVVQKNLGADSLQRWLRESLGMPCERYAVSKGYRVLRVSRAG
ncbi:MAG: class I SAM-dependent methyltransferase [Actinomycetota bacterium]|nr:class I SAM-dependent methyltransferase [Actinomycetota bacterium]